MKRNILVFGTIAGVIVATFMAISMAIVGTREMGSGNGWMIIGFASMAVAFSFVFVGIKTTGTNRMGELSHSEKHFS